MTRLPARAALAGGFRVKVGRAFRDPLDEPGKARVGAERFGRGVVAGQFGFGQRRMNFIVADLVEQHGRSAFATAQFRHEVVQALLGVQWDRARAQGADGVAHG